MIENEILEWIKNLKQERDEARAALLHPSTMRNVVVERDEARADAMRWRQDHHQLVKTSAQDIKVALAERDEALAELSAFKAQSDSDTQSLHKQVKVQQSIANVHCENYLEILKRIDVVAKERDEAIAELEPLKAELAQAIAERTPHDYGFLKTHAEHLRKELHKANQESRRLAGELERVRSIAKESGSLQVELNKLVADMNRMHAAQVQPEPSRLEIAAMLLSGFAASDTSVIHNKYNFVLTEADALIAAAKAGGGPGTGVPEYGRYVDGKWVGTPIPQTGQSSGGSGGCSPQ